jgi:hypothetical protein
MRSLLSLLLAAGMIVFISCNSTKKDKEVSQKYIDSLKQDSITRINTDVVRMKLTGKIKTLTETKYKAIDSFGEIQTGDIEGKNIIVFNEKGIKIEESQYDSNDSLEHKYTYKYDDKGNEIEMNSFKSDGSLKFKNTYKYDDKYNKTEENSYASNGSLNYKNIYKYDDKGNEIEEDDFKSDGSLDYKFTYKYDYNKAGNWLKETGFINDKPKNITVREINYY